MKRTNGFKSNAILHPVGTQFGQWVIINPTPRKDRAALQWECRCSCGTVRWVGSTRLRRGRSKSCGCARSSTMRGPGNCNWKGGRTTHPTGYIHVRDWDHPNADHRGYVLEHVKVISEIIGRPLRKGEIVHHKNGQRDDNRPENLELCVRKAHPTGQRVCDIVTWCVEMLALYAPEYLSEHTDIREMLQAVQDGRMKV